MNFKLIRRFNALFKKYFGITPSDAGLSNMDIERWCDGIEDIDEAVIMWGEKYDLDRVDLGWFA